LRRAFIKYMLLQPRAQRNEVASGKRRSYRRIIITCFFKKLRRSQLPNHIIREPTKFTAKPVNILQRPFIVARDSHARHALIFLRPVFRNSGDLHVAINQRLLDFVTQNHI